MVSGRDILGPYRLIRLVRSGQTTQIWEALRDGEKEKCALKILLQEHHKKKDQIALLKKEAEVGQALEHRYVIKVYDYSDKYGFPFVAMELFHAKNMKQALREQPELMAFLSKTVIRRCAKALAYLHSQGWVHCDVKPDNFLVSEKAMVKLLDFAIAQRWQKKSLMGFFGGSSKNISGTRSYMSPEQIRGKSVDPRADIYSLGCVIFEMLGGRTPFTGSSGDNLLAKHLKGKIPNVTGLNTGITPEMGAYIQKMMAKSPDDRPETMEKVLQTLERTPIYKAGQTPKHPSKIEKKTDDTF